MGGLGKTARLPSTSEGMLDFTVPCTATGDTTVGGSCQVTTTLEAAIPGAVRERSRAIWQLSAREVWDGGQDGSPQTRDDDTLFARQGVFVP